MAKFCLRPEFVDKFKKALVSREIKPEKLANMSSEERRAFIEKFVGKENAKEVNVLFESKLLMKNQQAGYITWAKKVSGLSPQARKDLIAKIERMDKALNPEEEKAFLEDFVASKLGTGITTAEAKQLSVLSKEIKQFVGLKDEFGLPTQEYMEKAYNLVKYLEEITPNLPKLTAVRIAAEIAGIPRALMTTADFSATLRQGIFFIPKHPIISAKAFVSQIKAAFSEKAYQQIMKDMQTDSFYSLVPDAKLAITELGTNLTRREEAYMSSWLERIPILGNIARGSARAYTTFLNKQRFDIFKSMVKNAQKVGRNPVEDKELLKNIAGFINTGTGRGGLGRFERSAEALSGALFSPRLIASRLSLLNPLYYARLDPFVRKEALKSLIAFTGAGLTVLSLAKLNGAEVETDSNSSDFGKIKIGRTRIDIWGGFQQYIRLASQFYSNKQKSTTTGVTKELGKDFGSPTRFDVGANFLIGKSAPIVNFIAQWAKGKNFEGEDFEPTTEALKRLIPIMSQDMFQLYKQGDLENLPYQGLALFGIGVQTYDKTPNTAKWSSSTSKELEQFKEQVGQDKFKEAESKFNQEYNDWLTNIQKTPKYTGLSDEDKQSLITKGKDQIKQKLFDEYNFEYEREEKDEESKEKIEELLPK